MIEIEKKYELSEHDMQIIESTCTLIQESEIKDYYLDTDEYTLFKHQYFLRLRNGRYELKIIDPYDGYGVARAQEIIDEDEINTHLKIFHITIDDTAGKVYIETKRKNFQYEFEGQNFSIDVDMYQYDKRYEIELTMEDDTGIDGEKLIEGLRQHLGLSAPGGINAHKLSTCALHQDIAAYEAITGESIA